MFISTKTSKSSTTEPISDTIDPAFAISLVSMVPVANAIAFGGILIGRLIAREDARATIIAPELGAITATEDTMSISKLAAEEFNQQSKTCTC